MIEANHDVSRSSCVIEDNAIKGPELDATVSLDMLPPPPCVNHTEFSLSFMFRIIEIVDSCLR